MNGLCSTSSTSAPAPDLGGGAGLPLSVQVRAAQHLLEARVTAQRVEDRIDLERDESIRALLAGCLQTGERIVHAAHSRISSETHRQRLQLPPSVRCLHLLQ
jgi:hypothetical protein